MSLILFLLLLAKSLLVIHVQSVSYGVKPLSFMYPFNTQVVITIFTQLRGDICGGTIINKRFVLTSSDCVRKAEPIEVVIHYGSFD